MSEKEAITMEELMQNIRDRIIGLEDNRIYFAMRSYKIKPITSLMVRVMKVCVAIDSLRIPITATTVRFFLPQSRLGYVLHNLGDKHLLILKREESKSLLTWVVHPAFKNILFEKVERNG